jgi:hypothetical protein
MRKSTQCRFCEEDESINHLFFECVVSKNIWGYACEFFGFDIGRDYISIAGKWLNKEKNYVTNMISAAMLRGIWLVRNDFVFHQQVWSDVKMVFEEDLGAVMGMEDSVQGRTYGDDDEVAFFLGVANPRTTEDNKRLKFSRKMATQGMVQMMDAPGTTVCNEQVVFGCFL